MMNDEGYKLDFGFDKKLENIGGLGDNSFNVSFKDLIDLCDDVEYQPSFTVDELINALKVAKEHGGYEGDDQVVFRVEDKENNETKFMWLADVIVPGMLINEDFEVNIENNLRLCAVRDDDNES